MTLHLIKLSVGSDCVADVEAWQLLRVAERKARGERVSPLHITRMAPKRQEELLDGGSIYWVIKGEIAARQSLDAIELFRDADGIRRCRLWLGLIVHRVVPRPRRAFQGWRYLAPKDAPPDISESAGDIAAMPDDLRRTLSGLGLL